MKRSIFSKRKIATMVLCALMMINVFTAAVKDDPSTVKISFDGVEKTYTTHAPTIAEFLYAKGLKVKNNDKMNYSKTDAVEDGMHIKVQVAKYVTIHDEDKEYGIITYQTTVEGVLDEVGASLKKNDSVYPKKDELIYDGSVVRVSRVKLVTFSRHGSSIQCYSYGKTVGDFVKELGVELTDDETVVPGKDQKLTDGMTIAVRDIRVSKAMSPLDFNADLSKAKVLICQATAYTPAPDECGPYANGLTATGVKCEVGVVAVDPRVIPLKSKLFIETVDGSFVYGYCTAEDTGGSIKGNKVDLAMNTKRECFQFGRRQVRVYVLS